MIRDAIAIVAHGDLGIPKQQINWYFHRTPAWNFTIAGRARMRMVKKATAPMWKHMLEVLRSSIKHE